MRSNNPNPLLPTVRHHNWPHALCDKERFLRPIPRIMNMTETECLQHGDRRGNAALLYNHAPNAGHEGLEILALPGGGMTGTGHDHHEQELIGGFVRSKSAPVDEGKGGRNVGPIELKAFGDHG